MIKIRKVNKHQVTNYKYLTIKDVVELLNKFDKFNSYQLINEDWSWLNEPKEN